MDETTSIFRSLIFWFFSSQCRSLLGRTVLCKSGREVYSAGDRSIRVISPPSSITHFFIASNQFLNLLPLPLPPRPAELNLARCLACARTGSRRSVRPDISIPYSFGGLVPASGEGGDVPDIEPRGHTGVERISYLPPPPVAPLPPSPSLPQEVVPRQREWSDTSPPSPNRESSTPILVLNSRQGG